MVWDVFRELSDLVKAMQAYVLGGLLTAASVYYNYYERTFVTEFRTSAVGFNLNDASLILAIGIPFAWYLATQVEHRSALIRWLNYLYLPAAVVAILLTGGRVSLVGTVPGFIFIFGTLKNVSPRWRMLAFVSVIAITYFAQFLIPQTTVDRLITGTVAEVEDLDLNGRKEIWLRTLDEYLKAPLLGIGVGSGPTAVEAAIHNTLFAVILETGVLGGLILVWLTYKVIQEMSQQPSPLLKSLWANVLWIVLLANMLHSWQFRKQTWLALTFMLVSAHMMRAGVEEDEPAAVPIEPALQHVTGS
jgi:O-antigen ligase